MRHMSLMLASCALAALSAETGSGSGSDVATPDPISKADPAPAPLTADQVDPADAATDPHVGPTAGTDTTGKADNSPPANKKAAAAAAKAAAKAAKATTGGDAKVETTGAYIVWAQPGHEHFGIGQMLRVPAKLGEDLRAAGRARYASEAEITVGGEDALDVEGV